MILLLIVCLMLPAVLSVEVQAEVHADAIRDIPFAERAERTLLMNIHRPEGEGQFPVLVYIYGGSYVSGDRNVLPEQGDILGLTGDGIAVVTFDYRYSQEAVFPAQILDVSAALCWLRQHGAAYQLDVTRLALWGHSAGGHLAALTGAGQSYAPNMDASCGGTAVSVAAVVSYFGVSDFANILDGVNTPGLVNIVQQLFGGPLAEHTRTVEQANVLSKLDHHAPPLFLVHGDADSVVPYQQSVQLQRAYRALERPVIFITVADGDHGHGGKRGQGFGSRRLFEQTRSFLLLHLGVVGVI